jgi:multiple antibiotic resistance protein
LGNLPLFATLLRHVERRRQRGVLGRDNVIALGMLVGFLLLGRQFMALFALESWTLNIAGGPILLLIALPPIAGPSAMTTIPLLAGIHAEQRPAVLAGLPAAWGVGAGIHQAGPAIVRIIRRQGLDALERVTGMILALPAVQKALNGIAPPSRGNVGGSSLRARRDGGGHRHVGKAQDFA